MRQSSLKNRHAKLPLTLMLYFKYLIVSDVDLSQKMLTFVLTFKLLVINSVDLVDLYTRIYHLSTLRFPWTSSGTKTDLTPCKSIFRLFAQL
jgi:hypothetical protein